MKFTTSLLLLIAGSFCLYGGSFGAVEQLPLEALKSLKLIGKAAPESFVPVPPVETNDGAAVDNVMPEEIDDHAGVDEVLPMEIDDHAVVDDEMPVAILDHAGVDDVLPMEVPESKSMADEVPNEDQIYQYDSMPDIIPESRASSASECSVNVRGGIKDPSPVFLKTNSEEFYPYSDTAVMKFKVGQTFQMFCPKQFTKFSKTLLTGTCVGGTTFKVDGTSYNFNEFVCTSWPSFVAEKTGKTCNGGILVRVGFAITSSRFAEEMQICFNEEEEVTRYVRHELNPGSSYQQTGVDRLSFQTMGFFDGKNVDKLYTQSTQMATINGELGMPTDSSNYFDSSKNVFLARGHMGAKADFVYGTQQRGTFLFINVAPQWQVFNAGNWARVEDGLRSWVSKKNMYVNCYTGVYGVTTLPNKYGVETPLYLDYDYNHNGLIPVPMIYFRVVIEPSTKRGIVFLGVNNPHLSMAQIKKDYILCPDVSDQVTYINWKRTDINAGYSYACEVAEFRKVVKHIPALTANGGLLV